jgi:hypothetical protein
VTYVIAHGRTILDALQADFRINDHLEFLKEYIAKRQGNG